MDPPELGNTTACNYGDRERRPFRRALSKTVVRRTGRPSSFFLATYLHPLLTRLGSQRRLRVQSRPAPRAHLYFAPSTATGISVEYGYAGTPCWNRYSAASSTWTSPASDATTGLWMPFAFISSTTSTTRLANTIGGVTIVCQ